MRSFSNALVSGWIAAEALLLAIAPVVMPDAPYADLVPAPDAIIWEKGQESTVLVSTNLDDVDLRISSVAMGISTVQGAVPHSGELMVLGASVGCQEWAVSKLTAVNVSETSYTLTGNVDRDNFVGTAPVFVRSREKGETVWPDVSPFQIDVPYNSADLVASNRFSQGFSVTADVWEVEASSDDKFPTALTRFITIDTDAGTATTDEEAESIVLLKDTGVSLKACSEHDDVLLTLHGDGRGELNRYEVDIGPEPTATPVPTATPNPYHGSVSRRVCVDDLTGRSVYLDGGELVGAAFTNTDFGLSGSITSASIGEAEEGELYRYFFGYTLASGSLQLTVSDAGAADTQGLDNDQVYPVRVTASDGTSERFLDVAVWVDSSNLSPGDGLCS